MGLGMDSKKLFKRKYRYIQNFHKDEHPGQRSWLGFYRIGSDSDPNDFFQDTLSTAIFPHYGFTFYEDPPGRIVKKGKGNTPSIYQSNRLINLGLGSLIKTVKSTDMFTDEGLASYRDLTFFMVMGTVESLVDDLAFLRISSHTNNGIWSHLKDFDWIPEVGDSEKDSLRQNQAMYEEVFHLNTAKGSGYGDFVYLTAGTPTSLVLSHATVQNIIHSRARHLKFLLQIPLSPDEDQECLKNVFFMDNKKSCKAFFNESTFKLFGIFPGLFGFKGAVFDVATGLLTGKRKDVVQFLLLLNGLNLLAQRDLRYLV